MKHILIIMLIFLKILRLFISNICYTVCFNLDVRHLWSFIAAHCKTLKFALTWCLQLDLSGSFVCFGRSSFAVWQTSSVKSIKISSTLKKFTIFSMDTCRLVLTKFNDRWSLMVEVMDWPFHSSSWILSGKGSKHTDLISASMDVCFFFFLRKVPWNM